MTRLTPTVRKLILVCTNCRDDGRECCAKKGSGELHRKLKEAVKVAAPDVRVSKSGCLDRCSTGASVTIMPDNVWLGGVTEDDVEAIVGMVRKNPSFEF
jgi:(2Fe-2S) ferredoxin